MILIERGRKVGKKKYHGFDFKLLGIARYDDVVTYSGTCTHIDTTWDKANAYEEQKAECVAMIDDGSGDLSYYSNGFWIGSNGS